MRSQTLVRGLQFVQTLVSATVAYGSLPLVGCDADRSQVEQIPTEWTWMEGAQEVSDQASWLFENAQVIPIHLTVEEETWAYLNEHAIELDESSTYSRALATIGSRTVGQIGLRAKGGVGTLRGCIGPDAVRKCNKLSYKLKFSAFDSGKQFAGLSRLNLHSGFQDRTFMRDYLAYGLFRRMGVEAPRVGFAEVFINGERLGLYTMVEQVDKRFLESRFAERSNGNLYKEVWPSALAGRYYTEELRTNRDDPNHQALEQYAAQVHNSSDVDLPGVVAQWFDLDRLDRFVAVDQAILHWDGPLNFRVFEGQEKNYRSYNVYLYQTLDNELFPIPWDMDRTFVRTHLRYPAMPSARDTSINCANAGLLYAEGYSRTYLAPSCDPTIRGLALSAFHSAEQLLRSGPFHQTELLPRIAWLRNFLAQAVARDPFVAEEQWQNQVVILRNTVIQLQDRTFE